MNLLFLFGITLYVIAGIIAAITMFVPKITIKAQRIWLNIALVLVIISGIFSILYLIIVI